MKLRKLIRASQKKIFCVFRGKKTLRSLKKNNTFCVVEKKSFASLKKKLFASLKKKSFALLEKNYFASLEK